ncbi:MAG: tetratricopeptide repeat protein, partial [Cyanobacteria bacterium P01_F01_bin.143]
KTCANNRDELEKLGLYYPLFELDDKVITNHSIPFVSLFKNRPEEYHANIRMEVDVSEINKKYEEQLNQILNQKYTKIVISGEGISSLSESELDKAITKIQSYGYGVRLVIFIRPPLSFINSAIQQKIKGGHYIESLNISSTIDVISKIESVFPETEFFSFTDACQHKYGPVGYFLQIIGVDDFSNLEFSRSNDSISAQVTRLISFINQEQPFFTKDIKKNPFRRNADTRKFWRIEGDKFQANQNEMKKFESQINKDNQYLLSRFGASFCDNKTFAQIKTQSNKWSDGQLKQLKQIISKVDENIKLIAYDYFKNIICLDKQELSHIFLENNQNCVTPKTESTKSKEYSKVHLQERPQLSKEVKFDEAIEQYTEELRDNPNCSSALIGLAEIYENRKEYEQAIAYYQQIIKIKPQHSLFYAKLGRLMTIQGNIPEAIIAYQKAIKIRADLPAWVYLGLGKALMENQELDDAISIYQKALEIRPKNQALYRLVEQSQALKQQGELYLHIWNSLNQTNFDNFDDSQISYPKKIDRELAHQYFSSQSKCKTFYLKRLSQEDKQFIQDSGLSLTYLELNLQKLIRKEGVSEQELNFSSHHIERQLSLVEENRIFAICPTTGTTVASQFSLFLSPRYCFYRFVGHEVFYLFSDFKNDCLYFPDRELIFATSKDKIKKSVINDFKGYFVSNWEKIGLYLRNSKKVKTVAIVGLNKISTAHAIWDDLSGIQMLFDNGKLDKIDKFLVFDGPEFYGGIDEIFPEINSKKVKRLPRSKLKNEIMKNNYFGLRLSEHFVRDSLAKRIYQVSVKKCSSDLLAEVEAVKKNFFPLLWVNFRIGKRTWLSQVEGIANILKNLSSNFPKLGVVFDGISVVDIHGNLLINPNQEESIKKEKNTLSQIQSLLPQEIKVYDTIGCPMYESIVWAHAIDLYMAPLGGGLAKVVSIANKPGVLHANKYLLKTRPLLYSKLREHSALSVLVNEQDVMDAPDDQFTKKTELDRSYDCDWRSIYEKVLKLASSLKRD